MEIKTFRAKTMQQALNLVRNELGSGALVLHTRELNTGFVSRFLRGRQYEIAASAEVAMPEPSIPTPAVSQEPAPAATTPDSPLGVDYRARYRDDFKKKADQGHDELHALAEQLRRRSTKTPSRQLPEAMFQAYTDMIESDIDESTLHKISLERLRSDIRRLNSNS